MQQSSKDTTHLGVARCLEEHRAEQWGTRGSPGAGVYFKGDSECSSLSESGHNSPALLSGSKDQLSIIKTAPNSLRLIK